MVAPGELAQERHERRAEVREVAVVGVFGRLAGGGGGEGEGEDLGEGKAG